MNGAEDSVIPLALFICGVLLTAVGALSGVIWSSLNKRLDKMEETMAQRFQTLGHEDRAIRSQIHDVFLLMSEQAGKHVSSIQGENERLRWMLDQAGKLVERGPKP